MNPTTKMNNIEKVMEYVSTIFNEFSNHPNAVCMDYISHLHFSFKLAQYHAYGVCAACIHGIFPFLHTDTVSNLNIKIKTIIEESGCKEKKL
mgnify:FL=1